MALKPSGFGSEADMNNGICARRLLEDCEGDSQTPSSSYWVRGRNTRAGWLSAGFGWGFKGTYVTRVSGMWDAPKRRLNLLESLVIAAVRIERGERLSYLLPYRKS